MAPTGPPVQKGAAKAEEKKDTKPKREKKEVDPEESKIPLVEQPDKKAFDEKLEKYHCLMFMIKHVNHEWHLSKKQHRKVIGGCLFSGCNPRSTVPKLS